jgi:hypothetical protein
MVASRLWEVTNKGTVVYVLPLDNGCTGSSRNNLNADTVAKAVTNNNDDGNDEHIKSSYLNPCQQVVSATDTTYSTWLQWYPRSMRLNSSTPTASSARRHYHHHNGYLTGSSTMVTLRNGYPLRVPFSLAKT